MAEIPNSGLLPRTEPDSVRVDSNEVEEKSSDELILEQARKHFRISAEAENDLRIAALEDLEFLGGNQWDAKDLAQRKEDGRPCLQENKLPAHVRQLENDQRQNRPGIKVRPVDDKADVETAKVRQGLIRSIERNSNADVAYDRAFGGAVKSRRGWFRILTAFESPTSFNQEIRFGSIDNPLSVYGDPGSKEPDGQDMNFGFVSDLISKDEFEARYPEAKKGNADEFKSIGDDSPDWLTEDGFIRVCEYFYKDFVMDELLAIGMPDGSTQTVLRSELKGIEVPEQSIRKKRKTLVPKIKWCLLTGTEILEKRDWLGQWIPLIPVYGDELNINGKKTWKGLISDSKDSQRVLNYMKSSLVETIALAPKAPYVGAAGQFKGHEQKWQTANKKSHAYLEYNPKEINGNILGAPSRQNYEPAIQALAMAAREANDDLKASTGINDASFGNRTNESSGRAIDRRAHQAQVSNFHFIDNLNRSIRHAGRIINDLIPHIYDTERVVQIIGEDDEEKVVKINADLESDKGHWMDRGKYDIAIDNGPAYQTKRQEAVEVMADLSTKNPLVMQAAGDIMIKNMDIPGGQEIADRIKKMMDPKLFDDGKKSPLPPQVQQQLEQMGKMVEQLTEQLHVASSPMEMKRMELESRERIAAQDNQVKIEIEMLKVGSVEAIALLKTEIAQIEQRMNILGQGVPVGEEAPEQAFQEQMQQEEMQPMGEMPIEGAPQEQFQEAGPVGAEQFEPPTGGFTPGPSMEQP